MKAKSARNVILYLGLVFLMACSSGHVWAYSEPGSCGVPKGFHPNLLSVGEKIQSSHISGEQYNSYFYTLGDVIVFGYYDNTDYSIIDSSDTVVATGSLNKDEKNGISVSEGIYTLVTNKKLSYLVGDPVSAACVGYYAVDKEGYAAGTEFLTYGASSSCGNKLVVFAFHNNTSIELSDMDSQEVLFSGTINRGEHYIMNGGGRFVKVTSDKIVSVLTHDDQGYYVASNTKTFVGTEFYTYTYARWTNGCNVVAYQDNTEVTIKNRSTDTVVWSGTLNQYEQHSEQFSTQGTYIDVTSSKPISVSMLPTSYSSSYHHGSYVPDTEGGGIGKIFVTYSLTGGYIYVFSYEDENEISIYDDTGSLINTYNLDKGEAENVNPGNGWYRIESTKYISVMSGWGHATASFVPVPFFFYSGDKEAPKISSVTNHPMVPSSSDNVYVKWETDEDASSFVYVSVNYGEFNEVSNASFVISHSVNIGAFSDGDSIKYYVKSVDYSGNSTVDNNNGKYYQFKVQDAPDIDVSRSISRSGNFFEVTLTVSNIGRNAARDVTIWDYVKGFQGAFNGQPFFDSQNVCELIEGRTFYNADEKETTIYIEIPNIASGQSGTVTYRIVPILFETDIDNYVVGSKDVRCVFYKDVKLSSKITKTFDNLEKNITKVGDDGVFTATNDADYLIVTNPAKLLNIYLPKWKTELEAILADENKFNDSVAQVLMLAGQLAAEKNAIMGYIASGNNEKIKDLFRYNWDTTFKDSKKGHLNEDWNDGGYLLIIGETNIIPSFSNTYDIRFYADPPGTKLTAILADNEYADIKNNDQKPEIVIGRLIGNTAKGLVYELEKSFNPKLGKDSAFFVSGETKDTNAIWPLDDRGNRSFKSNVNSMEALGKYIFKNTVKRHLSDDDYDNDAERLQVYRDNMPNKDLIYYRNHGGRTTWTSFSTANVPGLDYGEKTPFIYSNACLTGDYSPWDCLGEKFMTKSKAALFFGSTRESDRSHNNSFSNTFFYGWAIYKDKSIGELIYNTKRSFPGLFNASWDKYHNDEYNLYGCPRIGLSPIAAKFAPKAIRIFEILDSIDVVIPDYEVRSESSIDYASIPGGTMFLRPDRPEIPIYKVENSYPEGYKIQNVSMTGKSGLQTDTGLNLPITVLQPGSASEKREQYIHIKQCGWYPEHEFSWHANENPDGTTTLIITIFAFYYDECTTDVKFYKNYSFHVDYTTSEVEISDISASKYEYEPGENIVLNVTINNTGSAVQATLKSVIKTTSGDIVESLQDQDLALPGGPSEGTIAWDSTGHSVGKYMYEGTLVDTNGYILDTETESFRVGLSKLRINFFNVSKPGEYVEQGDLVTISMDFENIGSENIDANAIFQIRDESGSITEFSEEFTDINVGEIKTFEKIWETSAIEDGAYGIVAYVSYNSTSTDIETASVQTYSDMYISLNTDKDTYEFDEKVLVEAIVKDKAGNIIENADTSIKVIRPSGTFFTGDASYRPGAKVYLYSFSLAPTDPSGFYKIEMSADCTGFRTAIGDRTVTIAENPIVLVPEDDSIPADGLSTTTVTSQTIRNLNGELVGDGILVTVSTNLGEIVASDQDPNTEGIQVSTVDSIIEFTLKSAQTTGIAEVKAIQEDIEAYGSANIEFTELGSQEIDLIDGWNLISLCVQPLDTAIESLSSGISGKYISVWAFMGGAWKIYDPVNPGFSDLTTMDAGWGYWLNMNESATLTISGTTPSNSISLFRGWNLVGYPCCTSQPIEDALESITDKYSGVWAFMGGAWKIYDPVNPGFSNLTTMEPGFGYWILATESCTWTVTCF